MERCSDIQLLKPRDSVFESKIYFSLRPQISRSDSVLSSNENQPPAAFYPTDADHSNANGHTTLRLANLPDTPLDRRKHRINFKNAWSSSIEPIRFAMVRFFTGGAFATWSSPISKVHFFSLMLAHNLKAEVKVMDLYRNDRKLSRAEI